MILVVFQLLGALAAIVGSVALFGPWWTLLVFGALTVIASAVGEAIQRQAPPDNIRRIRHDQRGAG